MGYRSSFYGLEVRDEIAREFTSPDGTVDDMMAGLHELRARIAEKRFTPSPRSSPPEGGPAASRADPARGS